MVLRTRSAAVLACAVLMINEVFGKPFVSKSTGQK